MPSWSTRPSRGHHATRCRGDGLAGRRARTVRTRAPHRDHAARHGERHGDTGPSCRVPTSIRSARMAGRPQRSVQYRWAQGRPELIEQYTTDLVASTPDLILTGLTPAVQVLKRKTATIPILFANVADPVASGLVAGLAKPGGNVTGFTAVNMPSSENGSNCSRSWRQDRARRIDRQSRHRLHRKLLPRTQEHRALVLGDARRAGGPQRRRNRARASKSLVREPNAGILAVPELIASIHRALIFRLAISNRVPTVLPRSGSRRSTARSRPMAPTKSSNTAAQPAMRTAFSAARSRPTCRCRLRPSSISSSI